MSGWAESFKSRRLPGRSHSLPRPLVRSPSPSLPSRSVPHSLLPGMMAEAYFVFSVGNLKGIWTAEYPE